MTSKRLDDKKDKSQPADTGNQLAQTILSGVGLLGGSATCSLIGGIMGFVIGPVGVIAGALPGAVIGGLVGGTVGDKIGKQVDKYRLMENNTLKVASREINVEMQKRVAVTEANQPKEELRDSGFIAHLQPDALQDYEGDTMPDNTLEEDQTVVKRVVVKIERH